MSNDRLSAVEIFTIRKIFSNFDRLKFERVNLTLYLINPPSSAFVSLFLGQGAAHISEVVLHYSEQSRVVGDPLVDLSAWTELGVDIHCHVSSTEMMPCQQTNVFYVVNIGELPKPESLLNLIPSERNVFFINYTDSNVEMDYIWTAMHPFWASFRLENFVSDSIGKTNVYLFQGKRLNQ